jgi:Rap1a immunity proteins
MRAAVLGIAMGMMGVSALAQENKQSASYMLPHCRAAVNKEELARPADAVVRGVCIGIIEAIDFMMSEFPPQEKQYSSCPPSGVSLEQTVRVVITYTEGRPQRMNENFKTLAVEAIHDAWPCTTN